MLPAPPVMCIGEERLPSTHHFCVQPRPEPTAALPVAPVCMWASAGTLSEHAAFPVLEEPGRPLRQNRLLVEFLRCEGFANSRPTTDLIQTKLHAG
jgi:hypothetical protein